MAAMPLGAVAEHMHTRFNKRHCCNRFSMRMAGAEQRIRLTCRCTAATEAVGAVQARGRRQGGLLADAGQQQQAPLRVRISSDSLPAAGSKAHLHNHLVACKSLPQSVTLHQSVGRRTAHDMHHQCWCRGQIIRRAGRDDAPGAARVRGPGRGAGGAAPARHPGDVRSASVTDYVPHAGCTAGYSGL